MSTPRPRWKVLIGLLLFPLLLRTIFRFTPLEDGGFGGAASVLTAILVLLLALFWLIFLSRLAWHRRLIGLLLLIVLGVGLRFSVRLDGYMGEFFPQFSWVWTPLPDEVAGDLTIGEATRDFTLTTDQPGDFPTFLGPHRNNWVSGSELPADWTSTTPRELWRRDIGLGWGSFAVAGELAFTMEQRGDEELTICYQARTGSPVWAHVEQGRFSEGMGGDGPRSTPAVTADGKVLTLGAQGVLLCLDGVTGQLIWRRDTLAETEQRNLTWAKSCSPILVNDLVVVTLGDSNDRSLAAYQVATGELAWRAGDDKPGYSTPIFANLKGQPQVVSFNASSVAGHAPHTGEILWQQPVKKVSAHNASPVIIGDNRVLVGMGYGHGSYLIEVQNQDGQWSASELWQTNKLKPKFADMLLRGEHVYGLDEGRLICLSLEDGQRVWRGTRFKHGQLLGVGQHLLIQAENGGIAIAEATPEEERIVHEFDALSSKTWNHPVLAGRLLLVRNDREAIAFEY